MVVGGSARMKLDDDVAFGAPNTGGSPGADAEVTPNWWTD